MRRRRHRGDQLAAGLGKALFHFGKFQAEQGRAGSEHEIEAGRYECLVTTINLAEAAFRTIAMDRISHGRAGSDDTDSWRGIQRFRGTIPPRQKKCPAVDAATLLAHGTEFVVAPQTLPGAEVHFKRP
jgi:hypothetical protein